MKCKEALYNPNLLHLLVNIHMLPCRNMNVFDEKVLPLPN